MDSKLLESFETRLMNIALSTESVAYKYPHQGHGLAPISFGVEAGEIVLITGPSGCGKSTLARCLTGLIPLLYSGEYTGTVRVNGMRTDENPRWLISEHAGFVFQNVSAQMLATSVQNEIIFGLENLGLEHAVITSRLDQAEVQFGLKPLREQNPLSLSGGEQQKVALAAILARNPPVLVLDEPLSMLDSGTSIDLVQHLVRLSEQGTAVVICEHKREYLKHLPACRTVELEGYPHISPGELLNDDQQLLLPESKPFKLSVRNLNVSFNRRPILRNINFQASNGQVLAIVGRNGSGKTTLLRALSGLQRYEGWVTADNEPVDLSMVFQNPDLQLFNSTVREEVLYKIPSPDMALYAQLMHNLGLKPYDQAQPLLLSEGEKKRVAMATALMQTPQHGILLDEPSLGQDSAHKTRLIHLAHAVAATGRLVIMTTHDLTLASQADRLLVLDEGCIVGDGIPTVLLRDKSIWDRVGMPVPNWILEQYL